MPKSSIKVPDEILPIFEKRKSETNSLFDFSSQYKNFRDFNRVVNEQLKKLADNSDIKENITTYTFRHSWATIAQNNCGASTELVGFCLNHASAHKVTEGYIKKDFSKIDALNRKVIDFVMKR